MIFNTNKYENDTIFSLVSPKFNIDGDTFYFDNDVLISTYTSVNVEDYPPLLHNNTVETKLPDINNTNKKSLAVHNNQSPNNLICDSDQSSIILPESDSKSSIPSTQSQPTNYFPEQEELQGYTLVEKIGEGAFAKVFRAIPNKYERNSYLLKNYSEVAIKVARKETFFNNNNNNDDGSYGYKTGMRYYCPEHRRYHHHRHKHMEKYIEANKSKQLKISRWEDIQAEVLIHKSISPGCEYIVDFIDFQESSSYYYIILEKVNGGDVFNQLLKYTYFSEDLTRHIIHQLAIAIKHLHRVGVAHRDIKLENILFESIDYTPSKIPYYRKSDNKDTKIDEGEFIKGKGGAGIGRIKLADFGLSKRITMNGTTTPCGTLDYSAPEMLTKNQYSTKVDMWGVGCVLYTLLCGFTPFYEENTEKLKKKICEGKYIFLEPWWDEISLEAKRLVSKLLETDPNKRYDIDELLNDPWLTNYDCDKNKSQSRPNFSNTVFERNKKSILYDNKMSVAEKSYLLHPTFSKNNDIQRSRQNNINTDSATGFFIKPKQLIQSKLQRGMFITPNLNLSPNLKLNLHTSTIFKRRRNKILHIKEKLHPWLKHTQRQRHENYSNIS